MSNRTLLELPFEVLAHIFQNLDLLDMRNLMLTCTTLRDLILHDNYIWRLFGRNRLILRDSAQIRQSVTLSWYNRTRISRNWCRGIFRNKVILYHSTNYMPWIKLHNSKALLVAVGSQLWCYPTNNEGMPNCRDVLWNLEVPKVLRHDMRTNDISRFTVKNDLLVCGNRDGCIAVYKLNNIRQRPCLIHHIRDCHEGGQVEVSAVELINKRTDKPCVVTSSESSTKLCFWHSAPEKNGYRFTTLTNNGPVFDNLWEITVSGGVGLRCLAANKTEDRLAIGLKGNSKPLLLDIATAQVLMTAETTKNITQAVRDIGWHSENAIMFVTHAGKLQLVDIRTCQAMYDTVDPFQCTLYCVKSDGCHAIVVGSSQYSRCVLFDSRNYSTHVQMYFTQRKSSPVYSLDFNATKLIAAADRSMAVLDFNTQATAVELRRNYSDSFSHWPHSTHVIFSCRRRRTSFAQIISEIASNTFKLIELVINSVTRWGFITKCQSKSIITDGSNR